MGTKATRLEKLEAAAAKLADTYVPVDMVPIHARLSVILNAHHHGKLRKGESVLPAFARALRCSPAKLFDMAHRDRKRFRKRLVAIDARADADSLADEIVRNFLAEELTYQLIEECIAEAGLWLANMMGPQPWPGLCRVRPLRLAG